MPEPGADLVKHAQRGDTDAISKLYYRHHVAIFKYIRSRIYDTHVAENLTGEVFMRMLERLPSYRVTGAPFRAWLFRVARNLVFEHYRKAGRNSIEPLEDVEGIPVPETNPATIVENHLTLEHVQRAMTRLDPTQREVIRLRFLVGLPLREVASTMNKTVAAIKASQHRGLEALRSELKKEEITRVAL